MREGFLVKVTTIDTPVCIDLCEVDAIYRQITGEGFLLQLIIGGKLLTVPISTEKELIAKEKILLDLWGNCKRSTIDEI